VSRAESEQSLHQTFVMQGKMWDEGRKVLQGVEKIDPESYAIHKALEYGVFIAFQREGLQGTPLSMLIRNTAVIARGWGYCRGWRS
jgi:hypothetical protein